MAEVAEETRYVPHHRQKIAFVLSAMRHHAEALRRAGWRVEYVRLDDPANSGSLTGELARAAARHGATRILATHPGEWRVLQAMRGWNGALGLPVTILEDDRFLCPLPDFAAWAEGRRQLRMEFFYREMRRRTGLLMRDGEPEGGRWNFDAENRKPLTGDLFLPQPARFAPDAVTGEVLELVERRFPDHPGRLRPFGWAVTAGDAEAAADRFLADSLRHFGDYQDAMRAGQPFLYHSLLSPYLNVGLLDPLALCRRVEAAWAAGAAPLNAVEGFIRQIIGWREYVRGIYWLKMPEYRDLNALGADRPLPGFYWTGDTDMACVGAAVGQTLREGYAHHIQRLMVTGTFGLLAGISPQALHEWYLAVYVDAFEWVELPNTLGMSQFADGGLLASKPYAASGAYIGRMSDYCGSCRYDGAARTGPRACPFNALYWDFLARHRERLAGNPRLGPVYRTWDRMAPEARTACRDGAARTLDRLDRGERL
ncbi:cryptochrome/photolyase family protein [Azospirillum thermophilum]|uniref:cryptochrome/photolyase family protein n=1 Tax=Azospirillum thermophilum TaxID=2202148 RepID=UPI0026BB94B6